MSNGVRYYRERKKAFKSILAWVDELEYYPTDEEIDGAVRKPFTRHDIIELISTRPVRGRKDLTKRECRAYRDKGWLELRRNVWGLSVPEIANKAGVPERTIYFWLRKYGL